MSKTITICDTAIEVPDGKSSAPVITGVEDIEVSDGSTFDPLLGVSATDADGNELEVTVDGEVDTSTPGEYKLTYTATDAKGNTTTIERTITVVEVAAPSIVGIDAIKVNQGTEIDLKDGVTAILDGEEIDYTVSPETIDKCEVGTQEVTYTATGNGKTTTEKRTVTIDAISDPKIEGAKDLTVLAGEEFDPLDGVTATDGNGNEITVEVVAEDESEEG